MNTGILESSPLALYFTQDETSALIPFLKIMSFTDGQTIFTEGDEGNFLCLVAEGRVCVEKTIEGTETTMRWTVEPPGVFGEMALFDGSPRSGNARAVGNTLLYTLPIDNFVAMTEENPRLALKVSINVAKVLASLVRKTNGLIFRIASEISGRGTFNLT